MGFFAYLGIAVFAYYALSFVSVPLKTMVLSGPKITKDHQEVRRVGGGHGRHRRRRQGHVL